MANETNTDLVQVKTSIEAEGWISNRDQLITKSKTVTRVTNEEEFEIAGALQAQGSKLIKKLENSRKEVTGPIDDLKKKIMAKEKELKKDIETEVNRLKILTSAYATEQARKAEEERRRIEEAERKAAEAQVAAEAAAQADPFGFNAPAAPAATPYIPPATVQKAHSTSNRVVEVWNFDVLDANAVPRQFLSLDDTKVRTFLQAKKAEGYKADQIDIPGLKISATMQVYSRWCNNPKER